jgi:hypothetical protein
MTIKKLIKQCEVRLEYLKSQLLSNIEMNNTEMILKIETEIAETEQTLSVLTNS